MKTENNKTASTSTKISGDVNPNIAFKDFKSAVSTIEFEAVLEVAKKEYTKLEELVASRDQFLSKSTEAMEQIAQQKHSMPPGLADKLIEGLERKANREMTKVFKGEASRHIPLVDFLNRFQKPTEMIPYLDLNFLNVK